MRNGHSMKKKSLISHAQRKESETLSLDKKVGGENVEQRESESQRDREELGHPILVFTIARVLPEAHCPLTVGLCERARHTLSYYTASPTRKHRKEPGCMWVRQRGWERGGLLFHDTNIKASGGAWPSC